MNVSGLKNRLILLIYFRVVVRYQQGVGVYLTLLSSNLFNLLLLLQNIHDEKGNFHYFELKRVVFSYQYKIKEVRNNI